jgi:hypothetical protein
MTRITVRDPSPNQKLSGGAVLSIVVLLLISPIRRWRLMRWRRVVRALLVVEVALVPRRRVRPLRWGVHILGRMAMAMALRGRRVHIWRWWVRILLRRTIP